MAHRTEQTPGAGREGRPHALHRLGVVRVVAREEPDEDVGVEDDYRHPRRTSCTYPGG